MLEKLGKLRNQLGRRSYGASGVRVYHPVKSVQGKWMPNMWNTWPRAEMETVHRVENAIME